MHKGDGFPKLIVTKTWKCSFGHMHKSFSAADKCEIGLKANVAASLSLKSSRARTDRVFALRKEGKTLAEIGRIVGRKSDPSIPLSTERVRQMVKRGERLRDISRDDRLDELSGMAANCLRRAGVRDKQTARLRLEDGSLMPALSELSGCGPRSIAEIATWAQSSED